MKRKSPSAELVHATPNPFELIYDMYWEAKFGAPRPCSNEEKREFAYNLLIEDWCGVLEFPVFIWRFVLPRSLHAQIRVHRHWSFFSQSHQLHIPDEPDYYEIPGLSKEEQELEVVAHKHALGYYEEMRLAGILPSLARGLLPMHTNLGLLAQCSLRSMFKVVVERRCHILQGTYWNPLLEEMKRELCEKVDPFFERLFCLQPCDISNKCLSPIEEELRAQGKDPHAVCPRYKTLVVSENKESCCSQGCEGCLKYATENRIEVERSNKE